MDEIWDIKKAMVYQYGINAVHVTEDISRGLLTFHAITDCDTTSQFANIGKKTAYKLFMRYPAPLHSLGVTPVPEDSTLALAEILICNLYMPGNEMTLINKVRCRLFRKA